jgi:hypothetical protein
MLYPKWNFLYLGIIFGYMHANPKRIFLVEESRPFLDMIRANHTSDAFFRISIYFIFSVNISTEN